MINFRVFLAMLAASALSCSYLPAQDLAPAEVIEQVPPADLPAAGAVLPGAAGATTDKRAYGVLPNYRTAESTGIYTPLTLKQKYTIATKDTVDGPSYLMGGFFAGISQLSNSNPSFGQGVKGFAHRYVCGVADQDLGNFLTEAILPGMLHQDPRYFRKGTGSVLSRIAYAASRSVVAKSDSGHWTFNTSEFLGNGIVASLGNAYYPDARGLSDTMQRMFTQITTDSISQVMKEFWPDIKRKLTRHKGDPSAVTAN